MISKLNVIRAVFCLALSVFLAAQVYAQQHLPLDTPSTEDLTEDLLLNNKVKRSTAAAQVRWINDTKFILTEFKSPAAKYFLVDATNGKKTELSKEERGTYIKEQGLKVILKNNDIYLLDLGKEIQITQTLQKENNPTLSPDNKYVAFTRDNDLYTIRLSDQKEFRLTSDGSDVILNGFATWAYMEEIFGRSTQHKAFWWSPNSTTLAFFKFNDTNVPLFTITDSPSQNGYIEQWRYPKPGNPNAEAKFGLAKPEGGDIVWADFNEKNDQYFGTPFWKPNSESVVVQWMPRTQNTLLLYNINLATGAKTQVYKDVQKTWVNLLSPSELCFIDHNQALFLSDQSGWQHIYLLNTDTKELTPVTSGEYLVLNITHFDKKSKIVYFTCNKDNFASTDFYKVNLDGKNLQRLSFGNYHHNISLSPNAKYFTSDYSNINTPNRSDLFNTNGKKIADLTISNTIDGTIYKWHKTEIHVIKTEDGKFNLPIQITWPLNMVKNKKYPVLINVYGGPGNTQVRNTWKSSNQTAWYAKEGLIQVSIDHRGASHNGKLGQEYMYKNLGEWEIKDYTTCVNWLVENAQANSTKICINGFSYGGYISSMALCLAPDVFTHAIAGGSVTDWTLYDAPYTERFMDTPENNPEGYKKSSVLEHSNKIKGKLLLTHGAIDENVHLQNTMQLVDSLTNNNKDFELMIYPQSRHGYSGKKSKHFRILQDRFIYKYLLEKQIPSLLTK